MGLNHTVSVVIPTFDRPQLLKRAVLSALGQTLNEIEVIVVIDRPDGEATRLALSSIVDVRLRVIEHSKNMGTNAARNTGIAEARGKWIALLDDDDEWFPGKLEAQLRTAERSVYQYPVVICRFIYRTPRADFIVPRRLPYAGEHITDYQYTRRGLSFGEGLIQTSVIFAPRDLFLLVSFDEDIWRMTDLDWLLRAFSLEEVGLEVVPETLSVWNADEDRQRASMLVDDWRDLGEWVHTNRSLFTPRAYAAIIMSLVSSIASRTRKPNILWLLLKEAIRNGRPSLIDYLIFFYIWFLPESLRIKARSFLLSKTSTVKLWGGPSKAMKRDPNEGQKV